MKKVLLLIAGIFIFCFCTSAQNIKKSLYEAKIGDFTGNIEVTFWSGGIIEYSLFVNNESGSSVFHQKGFAINTRYDELKAHGMEFSELIGPNGSSRIPACQFIVECKCEKWLNIKVTEDKSLIQVYCVPEVLSQIFGNKPNPNPIYTIGFFYLKSSNK